MPSLRQAFADRLKQAQKVREARSLSTVPLMRAALKERDVAARGPGNVLIISCKNSKNSEAPPKGVLSGKGWLAESVDSVGSAATER